MQKPMQQAAGQVHYRKASRKYWIDMEALLTSSSNFINKNVAQLTARQNMPPSFQAAFNNEKIKFQNLYNGFLKSEENNIIKTEEKIIANNNIHSSLMSMLLDGQEIFKTNSATKSLFVFEALLNLIRSTTKNKST